LQRIFTHGNIAHEITFCEARSITCGTDENLTNIIPIYPKTDRICLLKEILSQHRIDTKILQSIYFAYKVGIISSYSNRI